MKNTPHSILFVSIFIIATLLSNTTWAQANINIPVIPPIPMEFNIEKMIESRSSFLTKKLNLNETQVQKIKDVLKTYHNKISTLRSEENSAVQEVLNDTQKKTYDSIVNFRINKLEEKKLRLENKLEITNEKKEMLNNMLGK